MRVIFYEKFSKIIYIYIYSVCVALLSLSCTKEPSLKILTEKLNYSETVSFGEHEKNSPSPITNIIITNNENEVKNLSPNMSSTDFQIIYSNCSSLKVGKTCTIKVLLKTLTVGEKTSSLILDENNSISLEGEIVDSSSQNPDYVFLEDNQVVSSISFLPSSTNQIKTVIVRNDGGSQSSIPSLSLDPEFYLVYNGCHRILEKNKTCALKIGFSPASHPEGEISGELSYGNSSLEIEAESLDGQVISSNISIFKGSTEISEDDFGPVERQKIETYGVKNEGLGKTSPISLSIDNSNFLIIYNSCENKSLKQNETCIFKVLFSAKGKTPQIYTSQLSVLGDVLELSAEVEGPVIPQFIVSKDEDDNPSGTSIDLSHEGSHFVNTNISATATDNDDYTFFDWESPLSCVGNDSTTCEFVLTEDTEVKAIFTEKVKDIKGFFNLDTNLTTLTAPYKFYKDDCMSNFSGWLEGVNGNLNSLIPYSVELEVLGHDEPNGLIVRDEVGCGGNLYSGGPLNTGNNYQFSIETADAGLYELDIKVAGTDVSLPFLIDVDDPRGVKQASMSATHNCITNYDNEVYCVGKGTDYEKGNNSNVNSSAFTRTVQGGMPSNLFREVQAGNEFSCGINNNNSQVYCWGFDNAGRTGRNKAGSTHTTTPQRVLGSLQDYAVKSLSVGVYHACAIGINDRAYCWGAGNLGQLAHNNTTHRLVAGEIYTVGQLSGLTIRQISAGNEQTCLVASNNRAYCSGSNSYGELGFGSPTVTTWYVPEGVVGAGITNFKKIKTGTDHTCAIGLNGELYCWGSNQYGQIGNGAGMGVASLFNTSQEIPLSNFNNEKIIDITLGLFHTCALTETHKVYCWGRNDQGQLGIGTYGPSDNRNTPQETLISKKISKFADNMARLSATCAITFDDKLYCWGKESTYGQFGIGTAAEFPTPVEIGTPN